MCLTCVCVLLSFDFSWGANIGTFLYFNGKSSPSAWFMQFKQRSRLLCLFKCVSEKHFYKYDIVTNEIHQAFQHNVSWRELTTINWSIHQDVLEKKETDNFRRKCKLSILKALKVHKKLSGSMMSTFHRDLFLFFSHLPKWILQMSGAMLLVSGSFVLVYFFFPLAPVFWMILPMCSLPNFWHPARKCYRYQIFPGSDLRYAGQRWWLTYLKLRSTGLTAGTII